MLEALKALSVFFTENSLRTRRNLRGDIERRSLAINEEFARIFKEVKEVSQTRVLQERTQNNTDNPRCIERVHFPETQLPECQSMVPLQASDLKFQHHRTSSILRKKSLIMLCYLCLYVGLHEFGKISNSDFFVVILRLQNDLRYRREWSFLHHYSLFHWLTCLKWLWYDFCRDLYQTKMFSEL